MGQRKRYCRAILDDSCRSRRERGFRLGPGQGAIQGEQLLSQASRVAAVGYCTDAQKAEAPENWFEQALAYGTGKLHGAVAVLSPVGAAMGQIDGYGVADYLIQHASRERRDVRVPASTWDAAIRHIRDADDAAPIGPGSRTCLLFPPDGEIDDLDPRS